jgi:hypothetical protein
METDSHLKQFTGWFIPVEIIRLYESRQIKIKSMILLALIDSLCKNGEGCYASNEWLAEYMQVTPGWVQGMLSELRRMGLLETKQRNGRKGRVLTTKFVNQCPTETSDVQEMSKKSRTEVVPMSYFSRTSDPEKSRTSDPEKSRTSHSFALRSNAHSYDKTSKNHTSAADAAQGGVRGKASLFGTEPITFDELACRKFIDIVLERGKVVSPASRKYWTIEFRRLRLTDGVSKERIKAVIKWYAIHVMDKYTPKAYHPVEFRRKFLSIEDRMKASQDTAITPVEVSPEAQAIVDGLLQRVWPPKARKALPSVVQASLEEYRKARSRVKACVDEWKKEARSTSDEPSRLLRVHAAVPSLWKAPEAFVSSWFESLHKSHSTWTEWSGDVSAFAFRLDHSHFQKMGYAEFRSYSSNDKLWNAYLAALQ